MKVEALTPILARVTQYAVLRRFDIDSNCEIALCNRVLKYPGGMHSFGIITQIARRRSLIPVSAHSRDFYHHQRNKWWRGSVCTYSQTPKEDMARIVEADDAGIGQAAKFLQEGGCVAFPTGKCL